MNKYNENSSCGNIALSHLDEPCASVDSFSIYAKGFSDIPSIHCRAVLKHECTVNTSGRETLFAIVDDKGKAITIMKELAHHSKCC